MKELSNSIKHRDILSAVMQYGRIMSQSVLFEDNAEHEVDNPLLKKVNMNKL